MTDRHDIQKEIISPGHTEIIEPQPNSSILFNYSVYFPPSSTQPIFKSHEPFDLRVGKGFMFHELENELIKCKIGEKCKITFPSSCAIKFISFQRTLLNRSRCACCSDEFCGKEESPFAMEIELVDYRVPGSFEKGDWELKSDEEKFLRIGDLKESGNEKFKKKEYKEALRDYERALGLIAMLMPEQHKESAAHNPELLKLKISLQLNKIACLSQMKEFDSCVKICEEILLIDPQNVKCMYRLAQATISIGQFEKSKEMIKKLEDNFNFDGRLDGEVKYLKALLGQEEIVKKKHEAAIAKKMFS